MPTHSQAYDENSISSWVYIIPTVAILIIYIVGYLIQ